MSASFVRLSRKSARSGFYFLALLLIALTAVVSIANAVERQAVVPLASSEKGDLVALIPGERELLWLLLMNGAFIIWTLLKDYWAAHKRKTDTSAEDIQDIKKIVHGLAHDVLTIKRTLEKVPTEKEVDLRIFQILHDRERRE